MIATDDTIKITQAIAPWLAISISSFTGFFGVRGFLLSKKIQSELKADEVLIAGMLHNPNLLHLDHENAVIQTTIFNKSKRKAYINNVKVFDRKNNEIEISWSDRIDEFGNPQDQVNMIEVIDSSSLCIRRNDGLAFNEVRVEINHSFDTKPMILTFDALAEWQAYSAKS